MDLISLVIINYNNKSYLKRCMNSIFNQTYKNLEIIFIDNESKDGSYDFMKEEYSDKDILLIKNEINNGYAGAANQGIKLSKGKYVMILNPDIIMEPDFIEKMHGFIDTDESIGALSGKLLKYDFENNKKLNYIDSAGIIMLKNARFIDRGQNEKDLGQYDKVEQVFGVCGAAPLYRKSALESVSIDGEYFDEDFFTYKEDIDLSWRLNLLGFKNMYYHNAVAYHGRGMNSSKGIINTIKNRMNQSEYLKGVSFRNHILMLYKNQIKSTYNINNLTIYKLLFKYIIFFILFDNKCLKYINEITQYKSKMIYKRENIKKRLNIE